MRSHTITGGGDVDLNVVETGNRGGRAVLFVHGYSQSHQAWRKQLTSGLAEEYHLVAMDLRGHGGSAKPEDAYADPELWADDIQATMDDLDLDRPVLVGWSYGGLVVTDYLATRGTDDVGGINLVGGISGIGTDGAEERTANAFLDLFPEILSTDAAESVEALDAFVRLCVHDDLPPHDRYLLLGSNVVVPPYVRAGLLEREIQHHDVLADLDVPALLTHGERDRVVDPGTAEVHADLIPEVEVSWYPEVGHSPFWEAPGRFNDELREFVENC